MDPGTARAPCTAQDAAALAMSDLQTRFHAMCGEVMSIVGDVRASSFDIATMTISSKLSTPIDIAALHLPEKALTLADLGLTVGSKQTDFPNQMTLIVPRTEAFVQRRRKPRKRLTVRGLNVKACSNGALNITGCKNIHEATIAVGAVLQALLACGAVPSDAVPLPGKVGMVNLVFHLGIPLQLASVCEALQARGLACNFNPERYAGVVVNGSDRHAFVFSSGSVTCGSSTMTRAVVMVQDLIDALKSE